MRVGRPDVTLERPGSRTGGKYTAPPLPTTLYHGIQHFSVLAAMVTIQKKLNIGSGDAPKQRLALGRIRINVFEWALIPDPALRQVFRIFGRSKKRSMLRYFLRPKNFPVLN